MPSKRHQLREADLDGAMIDTCAMLLKRVKEKGMGTFASSHEILGVLHEELQEYQDAVHEKSGSDEKVSELMDIAVAAMFGIASIRANGVDW